MPMTEAQKRAQINYNKRSRTLFSLCFHNKNDADIIEKLKTVESRNDYIRQLIRNDLKNENK